MTDGYEEPPEHMVQPEWCGCGWREPDPMDLLGQCPDCGFLRLPSSDVGSLDNLYYTLEGMPPDYGPFSWHPEIERLVHEMARSELMVMATDLHNECFTGDLLMPEVERRITEFSKEEVGTLLQHPSARMREAVLRAIGRRQSTRG